MISQIFPNMKLYAANSTKTTNQNLILVASRRVLDDYSPKEAFPINILDEWHNNTYLGPS